MRYVVRGTREQAVMIKERMSVAPVLLARSLTDRLRNDSLLRNSIYQMTTSAVVGASGYVYWTVAAHMYSAHDVGLASALVAAMILASLLSNLGIGNTLILELPRRQAGYSWSLAVNAGLITGSIAGLLAGGLAATGLPLVSREFSVLGHQIGYVMALIVGVPIWTLATILDLIFIAERAAGNELVRNTTFAVLRILLLGLSLLIIHDTVLVIFFSWILATGASLVGGVLLLIPRLGRTYCLATRGIVDEIHGMWSRMAGNHLTALGAYMPIYLLPVLVTVRLSANDNAYFYMTWMFGSIFFMVSPAVAHALLAEGSHAPASILRKARSSVLIIGVLIGPAILLVLLAGHLILSLVGPSYAVRGFPLLLILVLSAVPDAITNIYISVLRVQRRLGHAALLNVGMALLTLILAWILLPIHGIVGAGWAWLIAQTAGSLVVGAHALTAAIGPRLVDGREHTQ